MDLTESQKYFLEARNINTQKMTSDEARLKINEIIKNMSLSERQKMQRERRYRALQSWR